MPFFSLKKKSSSNGALNDTTAHEDKQILNLQRECTETEIRNKELQEENNLLKLKVEILLDMLAQKTAETSLQDAEIDRLKTSLEMMSPSRLRLI